MVRKRTEFLEIPDITLGLPTVALVGRTNVGKSSLFNKLTETHLAIVSPEEHVTRDRQQAPISWEKRTFIITDTGGFDIEEDRSFSTEVKKQVALAVENASVVLFVIEKGNAMPSDSQFAKILRAQKKNVILVVNKTDNLRDAILDKEISRLGFDNVVFVSAKTSFNTGDLLDEIVKQLPINSDIKIIPKDTRSINIAFIGKPNVGKSSIINAILNEQRVIVSPEAHTTRSCQIIPFSFANTNYNLIDTAGLRRKNKAKASVAKNTSSFMEMLSIEQTETIMTLAHVVVLVLDGTAELTAQDSKLASEVIERGKCLIIVLNKFDIVPDHNPHTPHIVEDKVRAYYPYFSWAPIIITSALEKKNITKILVAAKNAFEESFRQVTPTALDRFLKQLIKKHKPSRGSGVAHPRLLHFNQIGTNPPRFELVTEYLNLHPAYLKFMEKQLREKFGFVGTPVVIKMRPLKN